MRNIVESLLAKGLSSGNLRFKLQGRDYDERGQMRDRYVLQSRVGGAWVTVSQLYQEVKEDVSA